MYRIPVSKPSITDREVKYVNATVQDGWISWQAPSVELFEDEWAEKNNHKHGVACSSGTVALQLAFEAIGVKDKEVIVPEFTMVATAWAVSYAGGKPVFVDCGSDLNIDVSLIERAITPKTVAICPVHIYGRRANMDAIMDIAHHYGLRVVEDMAEAHGIQPVGDIAAYSLFANKIITTGEGGMCLTNDDYYADQMKHLRSMAFDKNHTFYHAKFAHNFRMSGIQAAFGLGQLERLDEILAKRRNIESWYNELLKDVPEITLMPQRDVVWVYDVLAENRDELKEYLKEKGIETRLFFKPMSMQPMYKDEYEYTRAYGFSNIGMYLPCFSDMTKEMVEEVCTEIQNFYEQKRTAGVSE